MRVHSTRYARSWKVALAPAIPYATVGLGLLVFHNAWVAILSYHAGMVAALVVSRSYGSIKRTFRSNGFLIPFFAVLGGLCAGAILLLLWPALTLPETISHIKSIGLNERTWPFFGAYFVLANPLIEESFWRGYLGSTRRGITANDALFSGYHLIVIAGQMPIIWLSAAFCALAATAWAWRQVDARAGGLIPSIVSHLTADAAVITTIIYMSSK